MLCHNALLALQPGLVGLLKPPEASNGMRSSCTAAPSPPLWAGMAEWQQSNPLAQLSRHVTGRMCCKYRLYLLH